MPNSFPQRSSSPQRVGEFPKPRQALQILHQVLGLAMAAMLYFAAVFVNCLLFTPVVKATTRESLFSHTGLDNVIFTSSVLFESESRSVLDCGRQCSRDARCVTFTHVTGSSSGSCRGHSDIFNSTSDHDASVSGAKTFTRPGKNFIQHYF